jgi:hypothetical protein
MTTRKLLTGNIHATGVETEERGAILKLRALVPKLSGGELTALAVVLIHSQSLPLGRRIGITAIQAFGQDLTNAVLLAPILSRTNKLAIAIELLESQHDRYTPKEETETND